MDKYGNYGCATNIQNFSFVVYRENEEPTVYLAQNVDGNTIITKATQEWIDEYIRERDGADTRMKTDIFEVCAGSVQDCINAELGGADRVELNSALYLGGLTPSLAMLKLVKEKTSLKVICMNRPRAAGFLLR